MVGPAAPLTSFLPPHPAHLQSRWDLQSALPSHLSVQEPPHPRREKRPDLASKAQLGQSQPPSCPHSPKKAM